MNSTLFLLPLKISIDVVYSLIQPKGYKLQSWFPEKNSIPNGTENVHLFCLKNAFITIINICFFIFSDSKHRPEVKFYANLETPQCPETENCFRNTGVIRFLHFSPRSKCVLRKIDKADRSPK